MFWWSSYFVLSSELQSLRDLVQCTFLRLLHSSCNLFRKLICCLQYKRSKRVLNSLSLSFLKGSSSLFKFPCATAIKVISGSDKSSSLHLLLKCLHPKYQWHTERKRCETYLCLETFASIQMTWYFTFE